MSNAASMSGFRPGEVRHAICGNCGEIVRVYASALRPEEIRLWWPIPLALLIWLAIIWKFSDFLAAPKVEMAAPAPVEARFVELPEVASGFPIASPDISPQPLPRQAGKPRIESHSRAGIAAAKPVSPPEPALASKSAPPADLMGYINAARDRRRAAEMAAEREYAEAGASGREPSADEVRMANVRRNLQPQGTNGVFQIVRIGARTAQYSFRGWTTNFGNSRRELIEVEAGPNGDVERAIVRSMIELIRKYYQGDFNWESQRLDRMVTLSARREDNAGLEDFLMREFFGADIRPRGAHPETEFNGSAVPCHNPLQKRAVLTCADYTPVVKWVSQHSHWGGVLAKASDAMVAGLPDRGY